jgi:hypothetical protein
LPFWGLRAAKIFISQPEGQPRRHSQLYIKKFAWTLYWLSGTNLPVAERIFYTNNRAEFFCDGTRNFCWLRWCQTRGKNCACTRQRATSNKSLCTVKNTTCPNFFL